MKEWEVYKRQLGNVRILRVLGTEFDKGMKVNVVEWWLKSGIAYRCSLFLGYLGCEIDEMSG